MTLPSRDGLKFGLCELDADHTGPHRSHDFTGINHKWTKP